MRLVFNPFTGTLDFVGTGGETPPTYNFITEDSDTLTTEGMDNLVIEEA